MGSSLKYIASVFSILFILLYCLSLFFLNTFNSLEMSDHNKQENQWKRACGGISQRLFALCITWAVVIQ